MNGKPAIFALSSGSGRAGIAVIRLSGVGSRAVLESLVGKCPPPRHAAVRTIRSRDGVDVIDQAMVLFLPGPHSVTGEDVVEFHLHGSPATVQRMLTELSSWPDCRPAEAGEFTRRAYANERMDLVEVEGLADLLAAESEGQRKLAMRQFSGEASSVYANWHREVVSALAIIEASIDFADEDGVAAEAVKLVRPRLRTFMVLLETALQESERASLVRRGLRIVIAGEPNVGKSSLLNALAGRRAAIVSDIAGTTRDVIEASVMMAGLPVMLADTAGLRDDSSDEIEREGVSRSRDEIEQADILIWVRSAAEDSPALPERAADLTVINKSDLVSRDSILRRNDSEIAVSVKTGEGLEDLRARLAACVEDKSAVGEHGLMVRTRHRSAISESIRFLNDALSKPDDALELMAEDVRNAAAAMATITGRVEVEDFLGKIFNEFCIGK